MGEGGYLLFFHTQHLLYIHVEGDKPEYIKDILKIVDWVQETP